MICATCELGNLVTNQYELFNDELCQCKWYSSSHEIQNMLIILMANGQQTTYIEGFGNILCTREAFKKVKVGKKG